jgi:hypothetical protein
MKTTKNPYYELFYRAENGEPQAIALLLERRLLRLAPCPAPWSEATPFTSATAEDGARTWYDTTEGTLAWDLAFPPRPKQYRERRQYSRKTILRALLLYQRYQETGLTRGTDGQIAAVCKRIDAWFAFNPLSEMERKVVFLHYMQGKTQEEVAALIKRSQQSVSRYAREALEKMEAYINNWMDAA